MLTYAVRRFLVLLATLLVASLVIFVVLEVLPGDVALVILGDAVREDTLAALRAELGLDRPAPVRYVGWIVGLIGATLLVYAEPRTGPAQAGPILLVAGVALVFLFSSDRPLSGQPRDYVLRLLDGLKALLGIMGAFGDVLSYMRLFALGLASASLALTFNSLALQAMEAAPGLGLLFAILILIAGHIVNLGLAVMSGVVHGLRLNFIEFYKWGMPGEGTAFRRFARKEVQP